MENQFFVDSEYLSKEALERKHRLETDPSFRKNHMEYLPGMEQIDSNVCSEVMGQVQTYDYEKYIGTSNEVSWNDAQPGDIVWRKEHMGIYLGNDKYIHAPQTGDVVKVSSGVGSFSCAIRP